jgi:hypothetical protein
MYLQCHVEEIWCERMAWFQVTPDGDQWQDLVNMIMNFMVDKNVESLMSNY